MVLVGSRWQRNNRSGFSMIGTFLMASVCPSPIETVNWDPSLVKVGAHRPVGTRRESETWTPAWTVTRGPSDSESVPVAPSPLAKFNQKSSSSTWTWTSQCQVGPPAPPRLTHSEPAPAAWRRRRAPVGECYDSVSLSKRLLWTAGRRRRRPPAEFRPGAQPAGWPCPGARAEDSFPPRRGRCQPEAHWQSQ